METTSSQGDFGMVNKAVRFLKKNALAIVLGIVATGFVVNGVLLSTTHTGITIKGDHNEVTVNPNTSESMTALQICELPETAVFRVITTGGEHYAALYEVEGEPRYDLTWQKDRSVVAVESLAGSEYRQGVEQWSPELGACVDGKPVQTVQGGH